MPRRSPSQQRSRETVEAIVEAAAQVFERHGYAAGTTNRIAERAGVSIGTLYQYFADKDAVLAAVVQRHVAEGLALLAPVLERLDDDADEPLEVLTEVLEAMVALHARDPNLHRLLFEETPLPARMRAEVAALEASLAARVAAWLRRRGNPGDARMAAWIVVQSVEALTHRWVLEPGHERDQEAFVREAARILATGLG